MGKFPYDFCEVSRSAFHAGRRAILQALYSDGGLSSDEAEMGADDMAVLLVGPDMEISGEACPAPLSSLSVLIFMMRGKD